VDLAVRLVREHGPEGIVLGSDAGQAGGDLLALPRAADRMARAGLSEAVIRRVCGQNALAFLGVDPEALARPKGKEPGSPRGGRR
jgi:predicted metal-dependent TIM-barrel fold hydrolase